MRAGTGKRVLACGAGGTQSAAQAVGDCCGEALDSAGALLGMIRAPAAAWMTTPFPVPA
jgi:hypothetical protein